MAATTNKNCTGKWWPFFFLSSSSKIWVLLKRKSMQKAHGGKNGPRVGDWKNIPCAVAKWDWKKVAMKA
jgi:hypothetical protein